VCEDKLPSNGELDLLQNTIEEVRKKLYASMKGDSTDAFSLDTYKLSDRLDKLIVEFLKVRERIGDTSK
jgi:hypothetical protein